MRLLVVPLLLGLAGCVPAGPDEPADAFAACDGRLGPEAAVDACTDAIRDGGFHRSALATVYSLRCRARWDLGDDHGAVKDCGQAVRHAPHLAEAYLRRGLARYRLGEYGVAGEDFAAVTRIEPANAYAHTLRGIVSYELDRHQDALKHLTESLRLDPRLVQAYRSRGIVYADLQEFANAVADFTVAVRLDPDDGITYNQVAWYLYLDGRSAEGLPFVHDALRRIPDDADAIDTRAHIYADLGRLAKALAEFERAMQAGGEDRVSMYQEALIEHGFDPGPADGVYRPAVRTALKACLDAGCRLID